MDLLSIDINADVGEGINNESELVPLLSSCNIACGGHAGDEATMNKVALIAKEYKVKVGAHPSYPDPENFGREPMDMACSALYRSLKSQVKSLMHVLRANHMQLHHVKPHGALYNVAAKDHRTAVVIVEMMKSIPMPLKLYVPYGSVIATVAKEEKVPITYEAFADRNYNSDLSLVSRKLENALITEPDVMFDHVIRMVTRQKVKSIDGVEVPIKASTFCVHGDNPKAIQLVKTIREKLTNSGIRIQ